MYERVWKRLIDITLSSVGIVVLAIPMLIVALIIKIDSPGPVFFRQKRIGIHKSTFTILKFRSMPVSVPHDTPTHQFKAGDTLSGWQRFMRRSSIDELPQMFCIWIGAMSAVGPRPALWNQYDLIEERDKYGANNVKPGLTGYAQINGRDELEIPVKAKFDGEYAKIIKKGGFRAFGMDIRCFFLSLIKVFNKDGVVEGGNGKLKNSKKAEMKIAVLSSHTPSLFWFRIDMMRAFLQKGHTVYALGNEPEEEWNDRFQSNGIIYRQIEVQRNGTNPLKDLKSIGSIKSVLSEIMPDKIFTYQAKTIIYGTIAANRLGIEEVYPLVAGLGSLFLKDDIKTKIVRKILMTEYRYSMRKCPAVFFQNTDDLDTFRQTKVIGNQKIEMLHGSGVSLEKFTVQPFPERFGFLCISRLIRDKGVYEYLEACRIIKNANSAVRCLLVGPFDSNPSSLKKEELQQYTKEGIIEYFGEQTDVVPFLAQCNVFVLPSYREGTPKTVLEAMACGRASITTVAPGCRETVDDHENGLLVPVKNVEKLAQAMQYMIDYPDEAATMGKRGRIKAENVFDVNKVNEKICLTMGL